jgi:hypothetical protein
MANIGLEPFSYGDAVGQGQRIRNLQGREKLLDQQGQANDQSQQLRNTKLLYEGAVEVYQNPGSAQGVYDKLKQFGIVDPNADQPDF